MKKNITKAIFTALFLLLSLLPAAGMLIFGTAPAAANEVLSPKPKLKNREGVFNSSVLTETSDYIADRFWLRQNCVTLWSRLNATLFKTSVDDSVILGSNGWIYYSETLDDYMGIGTEEAKLRSAAENLKLIQEYSESCGADFVFTVAPNKNSLYPENMPESVPTGHERSDAVRLKPMLEENGVNYADLFTALSQEEKVLYFKTDSHWNGEGAAYGADAILKAAGIESSFSSLDFTDGEDHIGDIYEMLYPCGKQREKDRVPAEPLGFETAASTNGGKALKIESECPDGEGRLICWRDSFGNSLYPYLARQFSQALFLREAVYDLTRLEPDAADTVIIELVERNIDWLITYSPVLPSPERKAESTAEGAQVMLKVTDGKENSHAGLSHIEIELDRSLYDFGTAAYIRCDGKAYEAWVSYPEQDKALLSVWIYGEHPGTVEAVCSCSGEMTAYPAQ